jgi:hypothetical protein
MVSKSSMLLAVILVLIGILLSACANRRASPAQEADGDGQQGLQERSSALYECGARAACARETTRQEPTVYPKQVLTGIITDRGEGLYLFPKQPGRWILVEENPNADCRGDKGPLKPGCDKMYFDITRKTDVYHEQRTTLMKVPAARLKKGQKVRADYTGYDELMSYPSQTAARKLVIMETP